MLELTNYTTDTAHEFSHSSDLADYREEHEGDEMAITNCDIIALNSLDMGEEFLDMTTEQHEILEVVSSHYEHSYFDTLDEALEEIKNISYIRVDGATSVYDTAHKLDYTIGHEDDLYTLLGCDSNSYEQLGSYISTDDIANLLEREYSVVITSNSAYVILT